MNTTTTRAASQASLSILPLSLLVKAERDDPSPLVLYHGRCADGFSAAWAAWQFYGGNVECVGLTHGQVKSLQDLPPLEGRAVYILDFSFAADILSQIDERAARLVLLDHHISAQRELGDYRCRCGVVHFDMNKSGARLAWEFFHGDAPVPDLIRFVEDRDLWRWQYPQTRGFVSALDMEPFELARWQEIASFTPEQLAAFIARGDAMDEKFRNLAADIARDARPLCFNGEQGVMVNAPGAFHSLVGDLLSRESGTFALMWQVGSEGQIKAGLRSQRGYDCSPLAVSMGGGGHAQACGFRMAASRLPELLGGTFKA
ncbi:phosphoesterase [Diaphorobacter ruginosibacter]|uniref:Phosphoesterase n=1 Tax=Diaphorobacter ruginosibacter TaxID=1715720 RepID=A0A7G9RST6_9BURK|nr:DHHA1 domain-containing protein [Diaphorobacter ruginosibacter]QNN58661.1 phosphoesterase [Diaphorobacter ruginosibacter]